MTRKSPESLSERLEKLEDQFEELEAENEELEEEATKLREENKILSDFVNSIRGTVESYEFDDSGDSDS